MCTIFNTTSLIGHLQRPIKVFLLLILIRGVPELQAQYDRFAESYDLLTTVAGKGETDDRTKPEWLPEFENGPAVEAELTRPHFAMADSMGNIFIADKDAHGIRKVNTEGIISTVAGTNIAGDNGDGPGTEHQLSNPNGLWVKPDGTVYILDLGNNKVRKLDTGGNMTTVFHDENGISLGRGIWVTPGEDTVFYSSATLIKMWTAEGGIQSYSTGYSGLGNICMDKNGFLVATDRPANLVYRISKAGNTKEIIAGNGTVSGGGDGSLATETGLSGVRGVWFLEDNSYFVATHEGSQIWYIDVLGTIHLFLNGREGDEYHSGDGENYTTPGYKISEARSVSVDHQGNVLVVENDMGFVRKIENEYIYYYTGLINRNIENQETYAFPNPATYGTTVHFFLDRPGEIRINLYDPRGQELLTLTRVYPDAGNKEIYIKTTGLNSGVYFYSLRSARFEQTDKLIIID